MALPLPNNAVEDPEVRRNFAKLALQFPVTTDGLQDGSVTSAKIADGTIVTADLADNAVTNPKLADNAVNTAEITDLAVTLAKLAANSVDSSKIVDGTIAVADLVTALQNVVPIATVTALPASPTDGQEIYYVADATNGVVWHFKYRSASASAHKWEFLGGPPLFAEVLTSETVNNATFTNLATVGPSVTLPLLGDWDIEHGAGYVFTAIAQISGMSYAVGATAATENDGGFVHNPAAATGGGSIARKRRKLNLAAGTTLTAKYRNAAGGNSTFSRRVISALPVRVS